MTELFVDLLSDSRNRSTLKYSFHPSTWVSTNSGQYSICLRVHICCANIRGKKKEHKNKEQKTSGKVLNLLCR